MNDESIVDIWIGLREYIDKKQIESAVTKFVDILVDNGVDDSMLRECIGHDNDLDNAIEYYLDEYPDEDEVDYDSQDWDED